MYRRYGKENWEKRTIIKDMVHGYIEIPKPIMKEIIDTEQFQRLKDIEQTGMEALYPSATHKRFTHSLGVYYLSKKAFMEFSNNVAVSYPDIYKAVATKKIHKHEEIWARWGLLFQLASLLHDSGHSPFSHTLEFIYDLPERADGTKELNYKLLEGMSDSFKKDFYKGEKPCGKPHERMSALYVKSDQFQGFRSNIELLLKSYLNAYEYNNIYLSDKEALDEDIEFMVRMIIGCHYSFEKRDSYRMKKNHEKVEDWYIELQLRNCIIGMLNSQLDVDNLDYVVRDSKFSGYASHAVDLERLLSSFTIVQALEFEDLDVTEKDEFDYCINLKEFSGTFFEGRITGACHIYCANRNFKAHGQIALDQQKKKEDATQRIYQAADDFSAVVSFDGENRDNAIITAPQNREQSCAYIHFKGKMKGTLKGTVFVNNFEQRNLNKTWREKGNLRINFAYEQKCMSVLMSAVYDSNFEKKWIYSHHISTFTNDFLYIYLLDKYAEYAIDQIGGRLLSIIEKECEGLEYEALKGRIAEQKDIDEMQKIKTSIHSGKDEKQLYEILDQKKDADLIQINNLIRKVMYICDSLASRKNLEISIKQRREELYKIIEKCCFNDVKLMDYIIDNFQQIEQKYHRLCTAEGQIYSDILAMYNTFEMGGLVFYKTSDRDLLAAYKNLYTQIINNLSPYDYSEFKESYMELAARKYLKCLWKSPPEFEYYFSDWTENEIKDLKDELQGIRAPKGFKYLVLSDNITGLSTFQEEFWKYLKENYHFTRFVCVPQQIRTKKFIDYEMYMKKSDRVLRLKDVRLFSDDLHDFEFFYFYYCQEESSPIDIFEILSWLKQKIGVKKVK